MARRRPQKPKEESASEAWLLPYSDLLTLLLALFIVLFAMNSAVKPDDTEAVMATFRHGFNAGGVSFLKNMGPGSGGNAAYQQKDQKQDRSVDNYVAENDKLQKEKDKLDAYIKDNKLSGEVSTELLENGLMIRIKEKALFTSGSADLTNDSEKLSVVIAGMLGEIKENVSISGHTDDVPISNSRYPSNWELSSQRALNFMKDIFTKNPQLNPSRFQATGYSQYRPISPNDSPEHRAQNRRVEILIERTYNDSQMQRVN